MQGGAERTQHCRLSNICNIISNKKLSLQDRLFGEGGILEGDFKNTNDVKKHRYLQMVTIEHCMKHTCGQPWHNLVDDRAHEH